MKSTNFVKYEPKEVHIRERHGDFYIIDLSKLTPDGTTTSTEEEEHSGADIISCTPFYSEFRKRIQYKVVQQNYSYKHLTKWYGNFYDAYKSALKYAAKRELTVIYNEEHDKHGDAREIMHRMHHGAAI